MSPRDTALTHHPAPHRDRVMNWESAFGLFGGPAGWFLQLCAGFALATESCFATAPRVRLRSDIAASDWAWPTLIVISIIGLALGIAALVVSWRILQRTKSEMAGDHRHLLEIGTGRTRFLALWGVCFSGGFVIVTLITFLAFATVPRCLG